MADIFVGCSKCGQPIPVDEQAVKNSVALGDGIPEIHHDVCPGEEHVVAPAVPERTFRLQIVVCEIPPDVDDQEVFIPAPVVAGMPLEVIAGMGHTVKGKGAAEAVVGPLSLWLNRTWPQLQEQVGFADVPASTTADDG